MILSEWYGNWLAVAVAVAVLSAFFIGFIRPSKRKDWRSAGIFEAYLIALFTEMFGFPLTIYLLSAYFNLQMPFDMLHGHLFAVLISSTLPLSLESAVNFVMTLSILLLLSAFTLIISGWIKIYKAKGLVVDGVYGYIRHPQYLGFFLIIIAFLIQWPTIFTVIMAPVLTGMYLKLARREERELEEKFGVEYLQYKKTTPSFLPFRRNS